MNAKSGFTLLELSVVLVAIGIVLGGILAGKSLIDAANVRGVIREASDYTSLVRMFKNQYNFYPGDYPNASNILGASVNGNGNGLIEYSYGGEATQTWYHLQLARMLTGSYTGTNEPISNALANSIIRLESNTNNVYNVLPNIKNSLEYVNDISLISPMQAYDIDIKTDDGIPTSGQVQIFSVSIPPTNCIFQSNGSTYADRYYTGVGKYNMNETNKTCNRIYFYID